MISGMLNVYFSRKRRNGRESEENERDPRYPQVLYDNLPGTRVVTSFHIRIRSGKLCADEPPSWRARRGVTITMPVETVRLTRIHASYTRFYVALVTSGGGFYDCLPKGGASHR